MYILEYFWWVYINYRDLTGRSKNYGQRYLNQISKFDWISLSRMATWCRCNYFYWKAFQEKRQWKYQSLSLIQVTWLVQSLVLAWKVISYHLVWQELLRFLSNLEVLLVSVIESSCSIFVISRVIFHYSKTGWHWVFFNIT